jgi:S1-C subfamily serine protease
LPADSAIFSLQPKACFSERGIGASALNPIVFLSYFLPVAAMAVCVPDTVPQTLDLANTKTVGQLNSALSRAVVQESDACTDILKSRKEDVLGWITLLDQNVDFMAAEEEKWAKEIMERKVPEGASTEMACKLDRDLLELEDFYARAETRMEDFNGKLNSIAIALLNVRAEKEIFHHPTKAERLMQCRDEFRERSTDYDEEEVDHEEEVERRELCLYRTGATPELWEAVKQMEQRSAGTAAGLACVLNPKARKLVRENLELAKKIETDAKKIHASSSKYFESLSENIPGRISQIQAIRKSLEKHNCAKWRAADDRKTESSVRKLQGENLHGTGFVLAGPNGKPELLSARHVGFAGDTFNPNLLKMLGIHAEKQPRRGIEFEVKPGFYDRGRDLIKRSLSSAKTSLKAVPEGTVVMPGEKVRIYGYPANREGKFTSHGCEVKGIGRNVFDTPNSESYLLSCPGAESHIGGMSGGPVVNEKGEVIGVVSAHNSITNAVVVQPVNRNAQGDNLFGFRDVFLYDYCFEDADISKPKRCQIIPGLTYSTVPY